MKAYLEVKDIFNILNFNDIDFVHIVNMEGGKTIERFPWGSVSYDKLKNKEYMAYCPTEITAKVNDDAKMELIIECCVDD